MNKLTSEEKEVVRDVVHEVLIRIFPNVMLAFSEKEKQIRAEKIKAHHKDIVDSMFLPSERNPEQNECYATVGVEKFYVYFEPPKIYTMIAADNIHHAANKVAKLWGDKYSGISKIKPSAPQLWQLVGPAAYTKIVRNINT